MDAFIQCCREHFNIILWPVLKRSKRFCEQKQFQRQSIGLTIANFHTCVSSCHNDFLSPTCKATFRGRSRRDTFYHLLKRSHIWSPGHHSWKLLFLARQAVSVLAAQAVIEWYKDKEFIQPRIILLVSFESCVSIKWGNTTWIYSIKSGLIHICRWERGHDCWSQDVLTAHVRFLHFWVGNKTKY